MPLVLFKTMQVFTLENSLQITSVLFVIYLHVYHTLMCVTHSIPSTYHKQGNILHPNANLT